MKVVLSFTFFPFKEFIDLSFNVGDLLTREISRSQVEWSRFVPHFTT